MRAVLWVPAEPINMQENAGESAPRRYNVIVESHALNIKNIKKEEETHSVQWRRCVIVVDCTQRQH